MQGSWQAAPKHRMARPRGGVRDARRVPDALPEILSAAGTLGIGAVVVQLVAGGRDRRSARASVLAAMSEVERLRWAPSDPVEWQAAVRAAQTSALIARIPRAEVARYLLLAQAGRMAGYDSIDRGACDRDGEPVGSIDGDLGSAIRCSFQELTTSVWRSAGARWVGARRRRRAVENIIAEMDPKDDGVRAYQRSLCTGLR